MPLWRALDACRDSAARSALAGLVFGAVAYAGGFGWLWRLVDVFLAGHVVLGAALWTAYGAWFAAGFAAYAVLYRALRRRGSPVALAGVASLVLVEWLQPEVFPVNAGAALIAAPAPLVQVADLGGPLLLTALVALANAALLDTWLWLRGERARPLMTWLVASAVALAVLAYGERRLAGVADARSAPALRVGIVQANLGVLEKRRQSVVTHRRHVEQTRELLAQGELDLVVWPETAYVRGLRRPLPISGRLVALDLDVPLLFGGTSVHEEDGRRVKSNSAFLVGRDGMIRDAYDKNLLIPLAEYAPLAEVLPGLRAALPHVQEFRAARDVPALRLDSIRIATPICYEAIRPALVRRMVRESGAQLVVTLANDAWFGDSHEPWMHLALARLRAVEHRRFVVRATNSGISAVIDPAGRIVTRTGLATRENLRAEVVPAGGLTPYARFGDWPGWIALALVVGALVSRRAVA
jgi:apolipoprotein N-acyltransferase